MSSKLLLILGGVVLLTVFGKIFISLPSPEISLVAEKVGHIGGITITNTIISAWVTLIVLTVVSLLAISRRSLVPKGIQAWIEAYLEAMLNLVESVAGKTWGRRFFPLVSTIFLFVITNNWLSLLPGFGTIGVKEAKEGHEILVPLFRNASTDLNTTFGLAFIAMFMVQFWGIRSVGLLHYLGRYFNIRGINLFVGLLELISEFARTIAFAFRLFGNMFAGEVLLLIISFLIPLVLVDVFYGLELFVGFVQALIFAMLTLVFATMAVASHEQGHKSEEHS